MSRTSQPLDLDALKRELGEGCAELVHEVSTPLATVKVNCEIINRYLPLLLDNYRNNKSSTSADIPPAHLEALEKSPEVVIDQITLVQQRVLQYWHQVEDKLKNAPGGNNVLETLQQGPALTLLCIEDDISQQDKLLKLLTPHHQLHIASTSREALKKCAECRYDIVLLATRMLDERLTPETLKRQSSGVRVVGIGAQPPPELGFDCVLPPGMDGADLADCLRGQSS